MRFPSFTVLAGAALFRGAPLTAQLVGGQWEETHSLLGHHYTQGNGSSFGAAVAWAGDLDRDGYDDFLIGSPTYQTWITAPILGAVAAYSGATGNLLYLILGTQHGSCFGQSLARIGDLDGDAIPDFAAGAPKYTSGLPLSYQAGALYFYSGAGGKLLRTVNGTISSGRLGQSVAEAGDFNHDGYPDVLAGAPRTALGGLFDVGSAFVFSGLDGTMLWSGRGTANGEFFGNAVAGGGDLDGDGFPDVLVGAPANFGTNPAVHVYSGASGSLLYQLAQPWAHSRFGAALAGVGDLDRDGRPDFVVGDPGRKLGDFGAAYVHSGASGALLFALAGETADSNFGAGAAGTRDADDDGTPDFLIGAPFTYPPSFSQTTLPGVVYLRSGASGRTLASFIPTRASAALFGAAVAGGGDAGSDGLPDLLVGAPADQQNAGAVTIYALDPYLHPSSPELSASSGVALRLSIDFPSAAATWRYLVLASRSGRGPTPLHNVLVPLTSDQLFGRLLNGWTPILLLNSPGILNGSGDALATILSSPLLGAHVGTALDLAVVAGDSTLSSGFSSIARRLRIVP